MSESFNKIDPQKINENIIKLIRQDWFLITAGNLDKFNTMTASWGTMGELWNKKVAFIFVRPTRFTYEFTEKNDFFSLSFFDDKYRDALKFCGTKSGRDYDKAKETGLTPILTDLETVCFQEAKLVLNCKKIYYYDIDPNNFIDSAIDKEYPKKDYHRVYVGEILSCLSKQ